MTPPATTGIMPLHDPAEFLEWRRETLTEVFGAVPDPAVMESNARYIPPHMADGSLVCFVATSGGVRAGVGAVCFQHELPSPDNITGACAYLMNIYVRKPYRRLGIGSKIVSVLVDIAAQRGCGKIYLESTEGATNLYSSLGFTRLTGYYSLTQMPKQ